MDRCHPVYLIRTLLRYLTLTLRHAPTINESRRYTDGITDHRRASSMASLRYLAFLAFIYRRKTKQ